MSTIPIFILFAAIASITPGSTHLLVFANSNQYGLRHSWPFILGTSGAAALLVLVTNLGAGKLFEYHSWLRQLLS